MLFIGKLPWVISFNSLSPDLVPKVTNHFCYVLQFILELSLFCIVFSCCNGRMLIDLIRAFY